MTTQVEAIEDTYSKINFRVFGDMLVDVIKPRRGEVPPLKHKSILTLFHNSSNYEGGTNTLLRFDGLTIDFDYIYKRYAAKLQGFFRSLRRRFDMRRKRWGGHIPGERSFDLRDLRYMMLLEADDTYRAPGRTYGRWADRYWDNHLRLDYLRRKRLKRQRNPGSPVTPNYNSQGSPAASTDVGSD